MNTENSFTTKLKIKISHFALAFALVAFGLSISNPPLTMPKKTKQSEKSTVSKIMEFISPSPKITQKDISQNTFLIRLSYVLAILAGGLGIYSITKKESVYLAGTATVLSTLTLLMSFFWIILPYLLVAFLILLLIGMIGGGGF